ncbi:MAG: UTP--glucose-1-phosphate uridylyltransferase [Phycisphaerae bacterium]|nr:UTP--glucose-1-phosphate uridylyltransferase [Phycisphaerae bacterium]MDW8261021.1 UTP--glucose-1-phosphate uridylyltransferase [Phycisphaerales bacterium]
MSDAILSKAVIPAAGFGTRMLPAAKAVPKEMLPVLEKPAIQYVIEECAAAGTHDILLITSRDKRAIEDHFDRHSELETRLRAAGRQNLLDSVDQLRQRVRISATRQGELRGLGHAVMQSRQYVGNRPFLCLLGDAVFSGNPLPAVQLSAAYARFQTAIIGLERVPPEKVERYGIVAGDEVEEGVVRVRDLVEKPRRNCAPGTLAIAARYVLTPAVFPCLEVVEPGAGGEIQLTDALRLLVKREPIHGVLLEAKRHDLGDPVEWLRTNLVFAAQRSEIREALRPTIDALWRRGD